MGGGEGEGRERGGRQGEEGYSIVLIPWDHCSSIVCDVHVDVPVVGVHDDHHHVAVGVHEHRSVPEFKSVNV